MTCAVSWTVRYPSRLLSGQREEQLLQLGFRHGLIAVGCIASHAFPQSRRDNLEPGTVQRTGDRGELGDDVLAVAALFDHRDHSIELSSSAAQSIQHCHNGVFITNHGSTPFPSLGTMVPAGVFLS